ncbi:MAG: xanthine dehydrogenase family protein molybdopterin-binding subunit, partial [Sphingomonadales bacterium]|nr:xanthine dehydrogenase family protein molybdopterin-binding subunit [Sphingomonadales bacterium]
ASAEGIANSIYDFDMKQIDHVVAHGHVPVGFWRSVGHSQNAFFMESFMDELAGEVGAHPFEFRKRHLGTEPRVLALLERLYKISDFDAPLAEGEGRGVAVHRSFGSIVGEVAHVRVKDGTVEVTRVDCVVDCGAVVNPDTVKAQMESGVIYGLTAAFMGEIEIADGAVVQSNFHDYDAVRMAQCPDIRVAIMPSNAAVGGVGEPGTPPIAPAVANAIWRATGQRLREMPFQKDGLLLG